MNNSLCRNNIYQRCNFYLDSPRKDDPDDECKPKGRNQRIMIQKDNSFIYWEKDQFNRTFTYIKYDSP